MKLIDFPEAAAREQPEDSADLVMTVEEVAKMLKQTPEWVRAHAAKRRRPHLPGMKMGKYHRFRLSTVRQWMAQLERGSRA